MTTPTKEQFAKEAADFIVAMKGVSTYAVARAMSGRGVSFTGCDKTHLAYAWARRFVPNYGYTSLQKLTLDKLKEDALAIIKGAAERRAAKAVADAEREAEWTRLRVARAIDVAAPHLALRSALGHLDKVLNGCRTAEEQQIADTKAREFLDACGGFE